MVLWGEAYWKLSEKWAVEADLFLLLKPFFFSRCIHHPKKDKNMNGFAGVYFNPWNWFLSLAILVPRFFLRGNTNRRSYKIFSEGATTKVWAPNFGDFIYLWKKRTFWRSFFYGLVFHREKNVNNEND